jgi:hypothetical protein
MTKVHIYTREGDFDATIYVRGYTDEVFAEVSAFREKVFALTGHFPVAVIGHPGKLD